MGAEQRMREHMQRPEESIQDFTFQYKALCLRGKPHMTEQEIVQATLCNCNPQINSILQSMVTSIRELVCGNHSRERF